MEKLKESKFAGLYKNSDKLQEAHRQEVRRKLLLEEQKRLRASKHDDLRQIEEFIERVQRRKPHFRKRLPDENPIQLSEWMKERPEDLEQWYLVPCPKGKRCLLISTNGKTELYNKNGYFIRSFHTNLPGDRRARQQVTILDCIVDPKTKKIFVLDIIAYGGQDLANCDTQFRFYWVTTKFSENPSSDDEDHELVPLPHFDMADEVATASCFERFPQFEDDSPSLDGFLFYHKDASYTYGTTPLVLWLFAFMVPEVLNYHVHPTFMMSQPPDYVDYLHYITQFDEAMLKRKAKIKEKCNRRSSQGKMDEDPDNGFDNEHEQMEGDGGEGEEINDVKTIVDRERRLEMEETTPCFF